MPAIATIAVIRAPGKQSQDSSVDVEAENFNIKLQPAFRARLIDRQMSSIQ